MSQTEEAVKRYETICDIVKQDAMGKQLISGVVDSADRYVGVVLSFEAQVRMSNAPDSENYFASKRNAQEQVAQLDASRRSSHNALISNLTAANRYLFKTHAGKVPVGGLYSRDPRTFHDRNAVGDWAGDLILGLKDSYKKHSDLTERV